MHPSPGVPVLTAARVNTVDRKPMQFEDVGFAYLVDTALEHEVSDVVDLFDAIGGFETSLVRRVAD